MATMLPIVISALALLGVILHSFNKTRHPTIAAVADDVDAVEALAQKA